MSAVIQSGTIDLILLVWCSIAALPLIGKEQHHFLQGLQQTVLHCMLLKNEEEDQEHDLFLLRNSLMQCQHHMASNVKHLRLYHCELVPQLL